MDPVSNPYAPGAGTPPPELAGRDDLRELVRVAVERVRRGMPAKSVILVGLRGVGKTVLLDRMREDAESGGIQTLHIEAPEGRSLPALIAPQLRILLLKLSRNEQARKFAQHEHYQGLPRVLNSSIRISKLGSISPRRLVLPTTEISSRTCRLFWRQWGRRLRRPARH
jgi:AAA ATPase-like protein